MESKSNVKKPDRIILFEIGVILALLFVNYILNLSYRSTFVVEDDTEDEIWHDSMYVYTEPVNKPPKLDPKPENRFLIKAEYFNPSAIITPISDLFKTIETAIMPSSVPVLGKIGPIVIAPIIDTSNIVITSADIMPQFPGGPAALNRFIVDNYKIPNQLYNYTTEVNLLMEFIVDFDGQVVDVKVISCSNHGVGAEQEARRVYNRMPKWNPGKNEGRAAKVRLTQPIKIRID